jgi:hypothetical protein
MERITIRREYNAINGTRIPTLPSASVVYSLE